MKALLTAALLVVVVGEHPCEASPPCSQRPGNKPCRFPTGAQRNHIAGPVFYTAQLDPTGQVTAVEIRRVPPKSQGFEEAVRSCIAEWAFEPVFETAGASDCEGVVRYHIAPSEETALRDLASRFASAWNSPDAPAQELFSMPDLAKGLRDQRSAADWNMQIESDLEYVQFTGDGRATFGQPFRRIAVSGAGTTEEGASLFEFFAERTSAGWRLTGWHPLAGPRARSLRILGLSEPLKIRDASPNFGPIPRKTTLILECSVSTAGKVTGVKILRGVPALDREAESTIRGWQYSPTIRDGEPIPIVVTVVFNIFPDGRVATQEHFDLKL